MLESVELQVISKILRSEDEKEIDDLLSFDDTYYSIFRPHIQFIINHKLKYGNVPDIFTFLSQFPDIDSLVECNEPFEYLREQMRLNKMRILFVETFNRIKDANQEDVQNVWLYIRNQCDQVDKLDSLQPMNIIKDAKKRAKIVEDASKQARIPTGFAEIDELFNGGLSTVEELMLVVARTNSGKSWVLVKMMESAQRHGFPVLYYSPEMQPSFLGTRFDTWRGKFKNSEIFNGRYTQEYREYLDELEQESVPAYVLEDKDVADNSVDVMKLKNFVHKNQIKLLIIDGLSYMEDTKRATTDYIRYKNMCQDLFKLSKEEKCSIVVAMQANRETKANSEDGKDPWPNLYNIEGSDHPGRIATSAIMLRQVITSSALQVKIEKSRNSGHKRDMISYHWDPNYGKCYQKDLDDDAEDSSLESTGTNSVEYGVSIDSFTLETHKDSGDNVDNLTAVF